MTSRRAKRGARARVLVSLSLVLLFAATACSSSEPTTTSTSSSTSTTVESTTTVDPASTTSAGSSSSSVFSTSTTIIPTVPVPTYIDENGFDDHTVPTIASVAEFFALARARVGDQSVVKFLIPNMSVDDDVHWYDSNFFSLHDEWLWFRLLNGEPAPASGMAPVEGLRSFATIEDVYAWADTQGGQGLPLDLRWVGSQSLGRSRLYSPRFYALALDVEPRNYGVGSVIHFAGRAGAPDRWLIELEFGDDPTPAEVARFFERLERTLPAEIGGNLEWVLRSPVQEEIAITMAEGGLPYADRIVRFSELVPAGEVSVYNEGVAAGRLLYIGDGGGTLGSAGDDDIVVIDAIPDYLPPAAALISSSPQTPLAHVNLLARNRGIPNASQAGIVDDAGIRQAARVRAPVLVRASGSDQLEIVLITDEEYNRWRGLDRVRAVSVPPAETAGVDVVLDLDDMADSVRDEDDIDRWRPIIGGKSAGFLTLLSAPGVTTPPGPVAITVEPYFEHMTTLRPDLDAVFGNTEFSSSARIRYLVLEGADAYEEQYPTESDQSAAEAFLRANPPGTRVGDVVASGGFVERIENEPIAPDTLAAIRAELEDYFDFLAVNQGLRFRSSSSVEDIEGFSGAGLYDSNTGFLDHDRQSTEKDRGRTVERAILKTWASYWGFEAVEERRIANIDHRSGGMGVLVHPRFDDELERANGVATFTFRPRGPLDDAQMEINVQEGEVSVANPEEPDILPEVIRVTSDGGEIEIERVSSSTLTPASVIDDVQISELARQFRSIAELWRSRLNDTLPILQHVEVVSLDFEFKAMAPGWPAQANGTTRPNRLVVKQVRSLDPGLRGLPPAVVAIDIPRDILARASRVERGACVNLDGSPAIVHRVKTDPLVAPDMGFDDDPLVAVESGDLLPGASCEYESLFTTSDEFLLELLDRGPVLNLSR